VSGTALSAIAVVLGPIIGLFTWLLTRRHREEIEDTTSMTEAMGAITSANVSIAAVVQSLINPMQEEVKRLAANEALLMTKLQQEIELNERTNNDHQQQINAMKAEQENLEARFTSIIRYVNILRRQILSVGHTPAPIPEDLDLSGFNFD
jgi:HAMP domain-containing protein